MRQLSQENTPGRKEGPSVDTGLFVSASSAVAGSLLACLVLSPMLCYQEKIGHPHQQWMLPQFLGGLCDYYSLSDIKSIYCIAAEDLLMINHLLYKYGRAFHLESVVVASC